MSYQKRKLKPFPIKDNSSTADPKHGVLVTAPLLLLRSSGLKWLPKAESLHVLILKSQQAL
jgi:hypothetical protein